MCMCQIVCVNVWAKLMWGHWSGKVKVKKKELEMEEQRLKLSVVYSIPC